MAMAVLSLRAYAKHRGVSLKAVQKAIASGRITTTADGKIDVARADDEWQRNTTPKQRPVSTPRPTPAPAPAPVPIAIADDQPRADPPAVGGLDYAKARAIREQYNARLAKIEYEERIGKLLSRDEIQVAAFNKYRTFRDLFLSMPDRLAAMLAAETDPVKVHAILLADIRRTLNEFADAATAPVGE